MINKANYYFVDINIVISYIQHENIAMSTYIDDPNNHFFYTETVKQELEVKPMTIPTVFKFISSKLSERRKDLALDDLSSDAVFHLSINQKIKFRNDLFIIFESGYSCYDTDVAPVDDLTEPKLLSHNLKLYKKFILEPRHKKRLEEIINLHGLEHLIEVVTPEEIVIGY